MSDSGYIAVDLTLDSLDLIQIQHLVELRIDELKQAKTDNPEMGWYVDQLHKEQVQNYNSTLKKIKAARQQVKEVKKAADAEFYANLKARRASAKASAK